MEYRVVYNAHVESPPQTEWRHHHIHTIHHAGAISTMGTSISLIEGAILANKVDEFLPKFCMFLAPREPHNFLA